MIEREERTSSWHSADYSEFRSTTSFGRRIASSSRSLINGMNKSEEVAAVLKAQNPSKSADTRKRWSGDAIQASIEATMEVAEAGATDDGEFDWPLALREGDE